MTDNGIFHPPVVLNGQVAGVWKRTIQKNKAIIETTLFQEHDKKTGNMIEKRARIFGKFLNKEIELLQKTEEVMGI